jgi:hypothetical protein
VFAIFILSIFFTITPVSGQDSTGTFVDATFNIEMQSATDFKISVAMDVDRITVFGMTYDHDDIQDLAASSDVSDIEDMGAIKLSLSQLLESQLASTFKDSPVNTVTVKPTYGSGVFSSEYIVNLSSDYFGLNETIDAYELINGLLDMGAILDYDFELYAESGWNNTYVITLGQRIDYSGTNGVVDEDTIRWVVRNSKGTQPSFSADLLVRGRTPTTVLKNEDVFLDFELDSRGVKTSLISNIQVSGMDIEQYDVLPDFITNLTYIPSDGIRLLIANGLLSNDEVYETTIKPIESDLVPTIESSLFNQSLDVVFSWDETTTADILDPYNVENMDSDPPITASLTDNDVNLLLYDFPIRAVFGLVNSGAIANVSGMDINFGDNLYKIGYPYSISLLMPEDVSLKGDNVFTWNDTIVFSGEFISDNATSYTEEEISTVVEIEVESTDLNLISILTGKTELTFGMYMEEKRDYNVTTLPEEFMLPEKISLSYLNSDAFRLCIEESVFSQESTDNFLSSEKQDFERRMKSIIPGIEIKGNINRNYFENSLQWDGDINNMGEDIPVKTASYAHISHPVLFSLNFIPPGVEVPTQLYNFSSIHNQTVTYRMIFPSGLQISATDSLGKTKEKQTSDGREYFEITLTPDDGDYIVVSCEITPSGLFILGLFTPCIISIFITFILIILIIILRRKRKGRKKPAPVIYEEPMEEEPASIEEEDYYIPPPPGSK